MVAGFFLPCKWIWCVAEIAMAKISPVIGLGLLVGVGTFFGLTDAFSGDKALLESRISELEGELEMRDMQLDFLRARNRVARVDVLEQRPNPDSPSGITTRLRFVELNPDGLAIGKGTEYEIAGDLAYFEALIIKFDDDFVAANDLLKGSSLLLFRRIFGEYQAPSDGFPLDTVGQYPPTYSPEHMDSSFHRDLWARFWEYALNPSVVRESGVRAMHGEAPFIKLEPNRSFELELRSSGGLTIRPID
jgi:hypothetical protein